MPGERPDIVWHLVRNHVKEGAEIRADQHMAYDELGGLAKHAASWRFPFRRVALGPQGGLQKALRGELGLG